MTGNTQTRAHHDHVSIVAGGRQERIRWRTGLLALMLAVGMIFSVVVAGADEIDPKSILPQIPKTDMKSGQITAKSEQSVEIDGRDYAFQKNVVFADDEGEWREWVEFKKRDEVRFHLKQGQIDYLILVPPK